MTHNRTVYVILGMLSIKSPGSGYEIRQAVESSVGYFWGESYGQLYPTLKQLAAEGLIQSCPPAAASGKRPRQQYALTAAGRDCLREWLALPFQNDPPRNEFLLKLFFAGEADPSVASAHILELNRRNRQMLGTLDHIDRLARQQGALNPHRPYWMLTLALGIALARAALDWGESALTQIAAMESAAPPAKD
jgi:DNA-binding PadR family transcriptional regulator